MATTRIRIRTRRTTGRREVRRMRRAALPLAVVAGLLVTGLSGGAASAAVAPAPGYAPAAPGAPAGAGYGPAGQGYDPADTGSPWSISRIVGARAAWARGLTGAGVDVAVIDTGVAPVPGLDAPGKLVTGPDLSLDVPAGLPAGVDAYGHGTFMAGLIAARDPGPLSGGTGYLGIAPDARIINVKVGAADGAVDVTQVIAAVDWVTQHAHDPGLNIKVISLSFGTDSAQAYLVDPLAQAIEQAWRRGIVVVAAAGNDGKASKQLANPAYDPYVIAAGGDDPLGTLQTGDDVVPAFAQHGNTKRPVDVTAPATHVIGLRVPGSFVDTLPDNTGQLGTRFQRGSGTSQATAIVAGVAALMLQKHPAATPDQVKALLLATATRLSSGRATAPGQLVHWGHGIVNADAATSTPLPSSVAAAQTWRPSTGAGTLDAARGGIALTDGTTALTGQQDIFGRPFTSPAMAAAQSTATAWAGGVWNGSRWTGDRWSGSRWTATAWTGTNWAGSRWSGSRWSGMVWTGSRWSGTGWTGSRWTGTGWDGSRWSTAGND